jgi:hypothetical protein
VPTSGEQAWSEYPTPEKPEPAGLRR